ncbi:MAG TPA: DUF86 domain-containing protein [Desulfobulbus sp.]|nr:DUF86 domain-containing protein [Desulfobulbus sp.]
MSERGDRDLLADIIICLEKIREYIHGLTYEDFLADEKTQDAVIRNIEIIGEASKKLTTEVKNRYPSIPWKMIAGTRDRLIHGKRSPAPHLRPIRLAHIGGL